MSLPWRTQLQQAITDGAQAYAYLGQQAPESAELAAVIRQYSLRIPKYYLDLIDPSDPNDPIALQCLPQLSELQESPYDIPDAVGDHKQSPVPGIVHKYDNRVILLVSNSCSMYCRYCFRKPVPKGVSLPGLRDGLQQAFAYLRRSPQIEEVILSGGDPLVLNESTLEPILEQLQGISHIKMIRIHSRVPVTLPDRIDESLVKMLQKKRPLTLVTHFNHPRELTSRAQKACARLIDHGIPLLNQAVLLRGVNNNADTLTSLFGKLYTWGVQPYYLHHCDRTPGTETFRTSIHEGRRLMRALKARLSGPAQPRYVLDVPGGYGKVPINGDYFRAEGKNQWIITLPSGQQVQYQDFEPPNDDV